MSMTPTRAKQLGQLIARARKRHDLSVRALAGLVDVSPAWITDVERAKYLDVSPDRLARIAQVLDIEPARIDLLTGRSVSASFAGYEDLLPGQDRPHA